MSVIQFNVPQLAVIPVQDINGNLIANPTPIYINGIQGFDIMLKSSIKQLITGNQFAIAGARGEAAVDGKIKAVKNSAELLSSLYTGQGFSGTAPFQNFQGPITGTVTTNTIVVGPTGSSIALGSGNLFVTDLGTTDINGTVLINVASSPATGQYSYAVSSGTATYSFNAADISGGLVPYISYLWTTATPPTGSVARGLNITNLQGGQTPVLKLVAATSFQGRKLTLIFPWTISSNLNLLSTKNLEFSGFEIDFSCFPDQTVVQTIMQGFFLE